MIFAMRVPFVWLAALLASPGIEATGDHAAPPTVPAPGKLALPEPIAAAALADALREQPANHLVLDLRPAWQFAEWSLPGARNVEADAVADLLATVPAEQRVVLVDRDGTLAFAVAGALMVHRPERLLRVLVGGAQHYHRHVVLRGSGDASPAPATPSATPSTPPAPPKKRGAGC